MNYLKRIGMVLALTLSFNLAFAAEDAAILLEEAIYTEETLGDIDGAIRIYQQIAENAESSRVAAQALYRLGRHYEGRGRGEEAKAAFARLAKQYPEQKELISRVPMNMLTIVPITKAIPITKEQALLMQQKRMLLEAKETAVAPMAKVGTLRGGVEPRAVATPLSEQNPERMRIILEAIESGLYVEDGQ